MEPADNEAKQSTVSTETTTTEAQPTPTTSRTATTTTTQTDPDKLHGKALAVRIIWFIDGFLMVILGLRFVLALLGASLSSGFVHFIYNLSQPFVAPFFGAFGYSSSSYVSGTSYFEGYTLLAMLVYTLVTWGIVKLITINHK